MSFRRQIPIIVDHASVRGFSHIVAGKPCQDSSLSFSGSRSFNFIIVSDGHGSDRYFRSDIGSLFAVEAGKEVLNAFMEMKVLSTVKRNLMKNPNYLDLCLPRLEEKIVAAWTKRHQEYTMANPFEDDPQFQTLSERDQNLLLMRPATAYGCTFISLLWCKEFSFVLKLGDGNCLLFYDDGRIVEEESLIDPELAFNQTTSLCEQGAVSEFRSFSYVYDESKPALIGGMLTTDGVINSFGDATQLQTFALNLIRGYAQNPLEECHASLETALTAFTNNSRGDDVSCAFLLDERQAKDFLISAEGLLKADGALADEVH